MKKVLFITRHYMHQKSGGSLCSRAYMFAFAKIFDSISIIYPTKKNVEMKDFLPKNASLYGCCDKRMKFKKALDIYCGRIHRFDRFVKKHLMRNSYDLIVIDHSILACGIISYIKKKTKSKIITIHHNVERIYNRDNPQPLLIRFPYNYFANKAEKDAINLSDLNIVLTKQDKKFFYNWSENQNKRPLYVVGIFENHDSAILEDINREQNLTHHILIISGSLNFHQTEEAITTFLLNYYNDIKRITPDVKLIITGREPTNKIKYLCQIDESITLIESPKDIYNIIKKGSIYVSPIEGGSGIKLRVMDGLKLGVPVLCHDNSARGYEDLVNDGIIFTYHDMKTLEESYYAILNCHLTHKDIYDKFESYFGFNVGVSKLMSILAENNLL